MLSQGMFKLHISMSKSVRPCRDSDLVAAIRRF
ncbi:hypothetical protein KP509_04G045400 [Ceratopteris richardii]|uniref:Uncharacterized protein n=1 Tax=Ceratopteris richardii TaxID=49495 RepID=A0A8T2V4F4_CERRI|nr:hypothetical protein KP509_04G045400 [Ceratopteris richardii]